MVALCVHTRSHYVNMITLLGHVITYHLFIYLFFIPKITLHKGSRHVPADY